MGVPVGAWQSSIAPPKIPFKQPPVRQDGFPAPTRRRLPGLNSAGKASGLLLASTRSRTSGGSRMRSPGRTQTPRLPMPDPAVTPTHWLVPACTIAHWAPASLRRGLPVPALLSTPVPAVSRCAFRGPVHACTGGLPVRFPWALLSQPGDLSPCCPEVHRPAFSLSPAPLTGAGLPILNQRFFSSSGGLAPDQSARPGHTGTHATGLRTFMPVV
jgi:hypothetical protein